MIHAGSLAAAGLAMVAGPLGEAGPLKSPGQLEKHYAPKAKLFVLNWRDDSELKLKIQNSKSKISNCHVIAHTAIPSAEHFARVCVIPHDAEAFARGIYAELHRCDEAGAQTIIVEAPPDGPEWSGIADRLRRAAS
jgi:L-threonylcarbamoyladenylate synthase